MWIVLAFISSFFLGCYDIAKKKSVNDNAVIPVLFFNTVFCSLLLFPFVLVSRLEPSLLENTIFFVPRVSLQAHGYIFIKSVIVMSAWLTGYFAVKHLPLTITGPINATRPVITLVGALLIFGERLNGYQWVGVLLTIFSFFLLSRSGRKEGIVFFRNKWIFFLLLSAFFSSASALYDKFLMHQVSPTAVQFWFTTYQSGIMLFVLLALWYPCKHKSTPFRWTNSILLVSLFLTCADFVYFYALTDHDAMISIVSMVRRSSVIVTFIAGAVLLGEKNLKGKAVDLLLIFVAMFFLYLGTR